MSRKPLALWLLAAGSLALAVGCEKEAPKVIRTEDSSAVVNVSSIPWDGVKRAGITYQLLVYSFADSDGDGIGDFKGIESRLDYLQSLGVSALWLSPIHPAASYHGYDVEDYYSVNSLYGTEEDFISLVKSAHERGIKIYLDYVLNHTSSSHPWFQSALSGGEDGERRDWYIFSSNPQSDIRDGKIAMIASEGASGYSSSEWIQSVSSGGAASQRIRFTVTIDDGIPKTIKAEQVSDVANSGSASSGVWLYYGNGNIAQFYRQDSSTLTLSLDIDSSWGVLVRTSTTQWGSYKYGAVSGRNQLSWGEELQLTNSDGQDILLPGMEAVWYHSAFSTSAFADLNYGPAASCSSSGAFKAVADAADKWISLGVDGMRLDAVKHIYHNPSSSENPTFLKTFYDRCNATYKAAGGSGDFYMVGENLSEAADVAPYYRGLPAMFEFSFWYRLQWALNNATGCYFANDILGYRQMYEAVRSGCIAATKLSNHDEDRTASTLGRNIGRERMAASVLMTSAGSPYIYQGEELGYWGTKDNGDEYVRAPMLWNADGSSLASGGVSGKVDRSMLTSSMSVEAQSADSSSMLSTYRYLAALRNQYPALAQGVMSAHGTYNNTNTADSSIACWYMDSGDGRMLVVHNFAADSKTLPFAGDDLSEPVGVLGTATVHGAVGSYSLDIGGLSSVVFRIR